MIIICDSSPLIALSIIGKLELLDRLFKEVLVPISVFNEATVQGKPESQRIDEWAQGKITATTNKHLMQSFSLLLNAGESETLAANTIFLSHLNPP